jgi:hypothetical protein
MTVTPVANIPKASRSMRGVRLMVTLLSIRAIQEIRALCARRIL